MEPFTPECLTNAVAVNGQPSCGYGASTMRYAPWQPVHGTMNVPESARCGTHARVSPDRASNLTASPSLRDTI